jgi:hypothetical protein
VTQHSKLFINSDGFTHTLNSYKFAQKCSLIMPKALVIEIMNTSNIQPTFSGFRKIINILSQFFFSFSDQFNLYSKSKYVKNLQKNLLALLSST